MALYDNPCVALYEGDDVTIKAASAITGKRFVDVTDTKDAALGTTVGATHDLIGAHAAAGTRAFGVSKYDQPTVGGVCGVHCKKGRIVPVTAGEAIDAGEDVAVGTGGKAVVATDVDAKAALATGTVGANNGITWTARDAGDGGEAITITIVDPAGNNVALSVDVDEQDIIVTSATDGASAISSTAAQVIAAINEHDTASQLVDVADTGASSGAGLVLAVAETALAAGVEPAVAVGKAVKDAANDADCFVQLF